MKHSERLTIIVIIQTVGLFNACQTIQLQIIVLVRGVNSNFFINVQAIVLTLTILMDEKHQRRQSLQEEGNKPDKKYVRVNQAVELEATESQNQVNEVKHVKHEPKRATTSCLQRFPFGKSFWQDTLIVYHWYNHMLVYLACALAGCAAQILVIGVYQFVVADRTVTVEAASLGLWIKLISGGVLVISAYTLLHGTCYSKVWLLYISAVVGALNLLGVISCGAVMKYETNPERIGDTLHSNMDKYYVDSSESIVRTVNRIQIEFTCCGVNGKSDFDAQKQWPESCCLNTTDPFYNSTTLTTLFDPCGTDDSAQLNFEGCTAHLQNYRESLVAPHYIFFVLAGLILLIGLTLTLFYIPLAKRKTHVAADEIDDQGLDDPFRRSLVAAAILGQIDDELVADEVFLPPAEREALERFRQRVAECHSMTGIHRIIDESADIIRIIKESSRSPNPEILQVNPRRSLVHEVRENERLSLQMQNP